MHPAAAKIDAATRLATCALSAANALPVLLPNVPYNESVRASGTRNVAPKSTSWGRIGTSDDMSHGKAPPKKMMAFGLEAETTAASSVP